MSNKLCRVKQGKNKGPTRLFSLALLVTSYCTLREQKGWDRVISKVTYTWWLLDFAVKTPWLGQGGPILVLVAWTGLENTSIG